MDQVHNQVWQVERVDQSGRIPHIYPAALVSKTFIASLAGTTQTDAALTSQDKISSNKIGPRQLLRKSIRRSSHGSETSGEKCKDGGGARGEEEEETRSRTFTLSRSTSKERPGDKDKKSEGVVGNRKSTESLNSGSKSLTSAGAQVAQNLIAKAKGQTPDDFVAYLRKVQKPELVEVGRLHKLRLLLRNETVAWTDNFLLLASAQPELDSSLSYLRDPEPSEAQRPIDFVLDMRRQRPYRVWCKEVTNVTKEVFWIFLHNLNVIPRPSSRHAPEQLDDLPPDLPYMIKYFPQELPPVPAAPYVGGVEWDATNYLASHLDIVNGCIASLSLPFENVTKSEKN
ncbi:hypothetical protein DID88_008353 [Monilinia fructigena]|uniref:Formin GTPase-binding domain-containing protein n=1 Tax=Monilinia fructigena TaxID=38457 RepID=A0A395J566_9HELO|nr:hypothetical protein DID88_008353 [Monilinia fructigena]